MSNETAGTGRPMLLRVVGQAGRVVAGTAGLAIRALAERADDGVSPGPAGVGPRPGGAVRVRPETNGAPHVGAQRTPNGLTPPPPPPGDTGEPRAAGWTEDGAIIRLAAVRLGEAALGLAAVTTRKTLDVASAAAMPVEATLTVAVRVGTSVTRRSRLAKRVDRLARIGRIEQRRNEREAALLLRSAWHRTIDRVVAETDVDGVLGKIDLDAVVARVDLDAVVSRVDVAAVVDRLDVPVLVERVLDDIDLGRIVRESSTGMATETVGAVRVRSAGADRAINGFVDRVILRRAPRNETTPAPGPTADPTAAEPPAVDPGRAPP